MSYCDAILDFHFGDLKNDPQLPHPSYLRPFAMLRAAAPPSVSSSPKQASINGGRFRNRSEFHSLDASLLLPPVVDPEVGRKLSDRFPERGRINVGFDVDAQLEEEKARSRKPVIGTQIRTLPPEEYVKNTLSYVTSQVFKGRRLTCSDRKNHGGPESLPPFASKARWTKDPPAAPPPAASNDSRARAHCSDRPAFDKKHYQPSSALDKTLKQNGLSENASPTNRSLHSLNSSHLSGVVPIRQSIFSNQGPDQSEIRVGTHRKSVGDLTSVCNSCPSEEGREKTSKKTECGSRQAVRRQSGSETEEAIPLEISLSETMVQVGGVSRELPPRTHCVQITSPPFVNISSVQSSSPVSLSQVSVLCSSSAGVNVSNCVLLGSGGNNPSTTFTPTVSALSKVSSVRIVPSPASTPTPSLIGVENSSNSSQASKAPPLSLPRHPRNSNRSANTSVSSGFTSMPSGLSPENDLVSHVNVAKSTSADSEALLGNTIQAKITPRVVSGSRKGPQTSSVAINFAPGGNGPAAPSSNCHTRLQVQQSVTPSRSEHVQPAAPQGQVESSRNPPKSTSSESPSKPADNQNTNRGSEPPHNGAETPPQDAQQQGPTSTPPLPPPGGEPNRRVGGERERRRERRERRRERRAHRGSAPNPPYPIPPPPLPHGQTEVGGDTQAPPQPPPPPPPGHPLPHLPDLLNSHVPPPYSTLPSGPRGMGGMMGPHQPHPPPHLPMHVAPPGAPLPQFPPPVPPPHGSPVRPPPHHHPDTPWHFFGSRRSRNSPRGVPYLPDDEAKSCCGLLVTQAVSIRWFIIMIAFVGLCCTVVGTVLGAVKTNSSEYVTITLLMIGVGIVLITVSGVAWHLTSRDAPCRVMLGLTPSGDPSARGGEARRFMTRMAPTFGRPHHPYAAMMYPEFQYRAPPPSYQASMQEYRLRMLLLDRHNNQMPPQGVLPTPPPNYPHGYPLRGGPTGTLGQESDYSRPPSYRSTEGSVLHHPDAPQGSVHHHHHSGGTLPGGVHSRDPSCLSFLSHDSLYSSAPGSQEGGSTRRRGLMEAAKVAVVTAGEGLIEAAGKFVVGGGSSSSSDAPSSSKKGGSPPRNLKDDNRVTIVQTTDTSHVVGQSEAVIVTVSGMDAPQTVHTRPNDTEISVLAHL